MTRHPAQVLAALCTCADQLVADAAWQTQQRPFVQHIQQLTQRLQARLAPLPESDLALRQILPTFDDSYEQALVALYGYARMLLDSPASFGRVAVPDHLRADLEFIYDEGVALARQVDELRQQAHAERRQRRRIDPHAVDLPQLLADHSPIWAYWLHDYPVTLRVEPSAAVRVRANPYHLADFVRHLLVTMARDLVEYGHLRVMLAVDEGQACVDVFCTGIRLTQDEVDTLLVRHGRDLYPRKLQTYGGTLRLRRVAGQGAAVQIWLPLANPGTE